ncbi:MAG: hypothetical protein ACOC3T_05520 [Bacteroidota bacterium]
MKKQALTAVFLLSLIISMSSCSKDDDCVESTWYEDSDNDGFGNPEVTKLSCDQPANFVANSSDVDDTDPNLNPNTVWQGPKITFTKENYADWTQEANQDRITDNVWITRKDKKGIFNIVTETSYSDFVSPADTEWAIGTTAEISDLTFLSWEDASGSEPPALVNQDMVVHLIKDNLYMDIKFTSWQSGGQGGGFSYERSTKN